MQPLDYATPPQQPQSDLFSAVLIWSIVGMCAPASGYLAVYAVVALLFRMIR